VAIVHTGKNTRYISYPCVSSVKSAIWNGKQTRNLHPYSCKKTLLKCVAKQVGTADVTNWQTVWSYCASLGGRWLLLLLLELQLAFHEAAPLYKIEFQEEWQEKNGESAARVLRTASRTNELRAIPLPPQSWSSILQARTHQHTHTQYFETQGRRLQSGLHVNWFTGTNLSEKITASINRTEDLKKEAEHQVQTLVASRQPVTLFTAVRNSSVLQYDNFLLMWPYFQNLQLAK